MRTMDVALIEDAVFKLCQTASCQTRPDIFEALKAGLSNGEESESGKDVLSQLLESKRICSKNNYAICQDIGLIVVYADIGQDVHLIGGDFKEAINKAIRKFFLENEMCASVLSDPLFERINSRDNTPAVICTDVVPGNQVRITLIIKSFGDEYCSRNKIMSPDSKGIDVADFIIETVLSAGPNACPPVIIGVGIGGTLEMAAQLAQKATVRTIGIHNPHPRYANLESSILKRINDSGIGPAGLGGCLTALAVNIEWYPTHRAGVQVVANLCCHAARSAGVEI